MHYSSGLRLLGFYHTVVFGVMGAGFWHAVFSVIKQDGFKVSSASGVVLRARVLGAGLVIILILGRLRALVV